MTIGGFAILFRTMSAPTPPTRKPYVAPKVQEHGKVANLTRQTPTGGSLPLGEFEDF